MSINAGIKNSSYFRVSTNRNALANRKLFLNIKIVEFNFKFAVAGVAVIANRSLSNLMQG